MRTFVEHTGELELVLEAETKEGVFAEGAAAFAELVSDGTPGAVARHEIHVSAKDDAALLAAWLEELVYLAETEDFVPTRVVHLGLGPETIDAVLEGHRAAPRHLVKAVTYNGLELGVADGRWRARCVLDV